MTPPLRVLLAGLCLAGGACGDLELKAQGEACFASSECGPALVCDLAAAEPTCQPTGSGPGPAIDAAPGPAVDAAPEPAIDAAPVIPDAAPPEPDAGIPDAGLPL